ncbi:MAG: DUF4258 domain-containing protein [Desulfosalsimonadaceae bacterium]
MYKKIQKAIENKNIVWRKHALIRMLERDISRNDVFKTIYNGKVIETYPDIKPYPGLMEKPERKGKKNDIHSWLPLMQRGII